MTDANETQRSQITFTEFCEAVDRLCGELYGLNPGDCGLDDPNLLACGLEQGVAPERLVHWIGKKFGLIRLREGNRHVH
jgi:hypothetical protein